MPLHDLSYQRFGGTRIPKIARSVALARSTITILLKRRSFLLLLVLCWIPVIVRAIMIYGAQQFPQVMAAITIDAVFWQNFLAQQVVYLPVVLVALYVGASSIATDLASGAFVLYLSKPISRFDYLIGKAIPILAALLVVTVVPALSLFAFHVALTENLNILEDAPFLPLSILLYGLWTSVYFTLAVLAVSSLTRSARVAGAGFGAVALGSKIVLLGALSRLRLDNPPTFLSMIDSTVDAGHLFFGTTDSGDAPFVSMGAMVALMVVAMVILRHRLTAAEVAS